MQFVSDKWYSRFSWGVTLFGLIFLIGSVVEITVPSVSLLLTKLGFSPVALVMAAVLLVYRILLYRSIRLRAGILAASLILCFTFIMLLVSLIHSTGKLHSPYHLVWMIMVFWSNIFGPMAVVGFSFLTTLYLILVATEVPGEVTLDPVSIAAVFLVYLIGFIGHLVWKREYVYGGTDQIAQLTGALQSKQQQAEILIQSIADGIIVTDTEGKINLMNPAAAAMTEWPIKEGVGIDVRSVTKFTTEKDTELPASDHPFQQILLNKQPIEQILMLTGRSGKKQTVSLAVSPVALPGSQQFTGVVAVIRDISAQRAQEQQRAEFISTASHEMRTPVAAIEGYLALAMNDKVSKIDSKARSYLEKAHSSTQHLGKLFQDLLTSAKAEDGRLVSHPTVVEMGAFVDQMVEALRFSAEKKGLLMDYTVGAAPSASQSGLGAKVVRPLYYVHVDPDRLREVVTNIFDNAVKYTPSGRISLGLTGNNEVVQVFVRDTGPGIPAEDVPHLFQKFYRVDSSATRTIGGTGLGLFICKKIVELYKGRIWAESELGKGSTFYINLPRLSTQRASELQTQEAQSAGPATVTSLTTPVI